MDETALTFFDKIPILLIKVQLWEKRFGICQYIRLQTRNSWKYQSATKKFEDWES